MPTDNIMNIAFITVHNSDGSEKELQQLQDDTCENLYVLLTFEYEADIVHMEVLKPVQTIIEDKLLSLCTNKKADFIIITGNMESAERDCVNSAIEAVINNKHHRIIEDSITNIKTKLEEIMNYRTACGIRDKTLIVNLPHPQKHNYFQEIANMLQSTWRLIYEERDINAAMSLLDLSCFNNILEQRKDEDANKSSDKFSPSCSSSSTKDMDDNKNDSMKLIPLEDALNKLISVANASRNEIYRELVDISDAYGRILCEDVRSNCNVPPCKTSRKHGYAVIAFDGKGLRRLLNGENRFPPISLEPGTCVWVNSGDPVPNEASAVIQEKDTNLIKRSSDNGKVYIEIMIKPAHGQNINPIGCDIMKGKVIVKEFTCIGPEEMGLLVASGCQKVLVTPQLSIGVLSIGDNLEEPGKPLKLGYVYDINRVTIITLLKQNGFSTLDFGIVNNTFSSIQENIKKALKIVDILVTTGSVNDKLLLKTVLEKYFKASIHFGYINIKPGRTTTLATCKIGDKMKYFLCLSENPLSAFVTAHLFLLPLVKIMCSNVYSEYTIMPVIIDRSIVLHDRRRILWSYLRWSSEESLVTASNIDISFEDRLRNIAGSNAFLVLPQRTENQHIALKGSTMSAILVDFPGNKVDHLLPHCKQSLTKENQ